MNKTPSRTIENAISVILSVVLISGFSTFVQTSSAQEKYEALLVQQAEEAKQNKELMIKKFSEQKTPFTDEELAQVLSLAGFEGKALKTAWAVVKKESNGRPLAFNGNRRTGDSSYGIFQINMIGGLGEDRRERYDLKTNKELFNPLLNAEIAYQMTGAGDDWSSWKVGKGYNGTDQARFLEWFKKFPEGVELP